MSFVCQFSSVQSIDRLGLFVFLFFSFFLGGGGRHEGRFSGDPLPVSSVGDIVSNAGMDRDVRSFTLSIQYSTVLLTMLERMKKLSYLQQICGPTKNH